MKEVHFRISEKLLSFFARAFYAVDNKHDAFRTCWQILTVVLTEVKKKRFTTNVSKPKIGFAG